MLNYLIRSTKQLKRFWIRSLTTITGLTVMVIVITLLLNFTIQIDRLFEQNNMDYLNMYKIIRLDTHGISVSESKYSDIKKIGGVESILPVFKGMIRYSWINNESIDEYHVFPIMVSYYDPKYGKDFFAGEMMVDSIDGIGVVISSDFRKNMMTHEQYLTTIGNVKNSGFDSVRLETEYQKRGFPMSEEIAEVPLVGKKLILKIEDEYDDSIKKEIVALDIIGEVKSEYLNLGRSGEVVLFPFKIPSSSRNIPIKYDGLLVKTKTVADVLKVTEELNNKGYPVVTPLKYLKDSFNNQKKFLYNILIVMGIILILAILSLSNTTQSIIQERRGEIALRKALGATSFQIIFEIVLEGLLIASISLLVGFLLVIGAIKGISYMISTDIIKPLYYEAFRLNKESALFLLRIPFYVYNYIAIATLLLGFLMSYLPTKRFINEDYLTLIRRD